MLFAFTIGQQPITQWFVTNYKGKHINSQKHTRTLRNCRHYLIDLIELRSHSLILQALSYQFGRARPSVLEHERIDSVNVSSNRFHQPQSVYDKFFQE